MWNFADLKNRIPRSSGFWQFFRSMRIHPLVSTPKKHQSVSTFFFLRCANPFVSVRPRKVAAFLMTCKSTYKWNFANLKKVLKFWVPQDSSTFLDLRNSTFEYSKKYAKCLDNFHPVLCGFVCDGLGSKSWGIYHGLSEYLKAELCKSEKHVRILR